jgi:hypothetical protein
VRCCDQPRPRHRPGLFHEKLAVNARLSGGDPSHTLTVILSLRQPIRGETHASADAHVGSLVGDTTMDPIFLGMVFAIIWLSSSLLADDLESLRAAEHRLARCPAHA